MATYLNLRISSALGERLKKHAKLIGYSANQFSEESIAGICDMIEAKTARALPRVVSLVDAASPGRSDANVGKFPTTPDRLTTTEEMMVIVASLVHDVGMLREQMGLQSAETNTAARELEKILCPPSTSRLRGPEIPAHVVHSTRSPSSTISSEGSEKPATTSGPRQPKSTKPLRKMARKEAPAG